MLTTAAALAGGLCVGLVCLLRKRRRRRRSGPATLAPSTVVPSRTTSTLPGERHQSNHQSNHGSDPTHERGGRSGGLQLLGMTKLARSGTRVADSASLEWCDTATGARSTAGGDERVECVSASGSAADPRVKSPASGSAEQQSASGSGYGASQGDVGTSTAVEITASDVPATAATARSARKVRACVPVLGAGTRRVGGLRAHRVRKHRALRQESHESEDEDDKQEAHVDGDVARATDADADSEAASRDSAGSCAAAGPQRDKQRHQQIQQLDLD